MKAVLTVIGKDKVGIISRVSGYFEKINANIEDISQTVLKDYFCMIMLVDISAAKLKIAEISAQLDKIGQDTGLNIRIQHEDVFNVMHKI